MNYTWKEETELKQELDPDINPYAVKPFVPEPEGHWQDMLRGTPVNEAVEQIQAEPLMPSKLDETPQYPEVERPYRVPADGDAVRIGILCRKSRASMADSMRYAIEAGHLLIAKKDSLAHGEWLPWLEANADTLGFDNRSTASRLMKLAKEYGSPNGAPAHHLNDVDVLQIDRQIWGHDKTRKAQAPKPKVEAISPPASKMDIDLSFLSVDDRQRVEAIIHRVQQQSNDQIKALAKENADLRTRIQQLKQEYKSCSIPPVQESPGSCSIPLVQEYLGTCSIPPVQESLASNVDDINPATGSRWKRLKDFLLAQDCVSSSVSSSSVASVQESVSSPSSLQVNETMVSSNSSSIPPVKESESLAPSSDPPVKKSLSRYQYLAENWHSIPDPEGKKVLAECRKRLEEGYLGSPNQGEFSSQWHMPSAPREYPATNTPLHDHSDISEFSSFRRSPVTESPASDDLPDFEDHPNPFWLEELEDRLRDNSEDCYELGDEEALLAPYRSSESPVTLRRGPNE
jgi:hypothetical protein